MNIIGKGPLGDSPLGFDGIVEDDNTMPVSWYEYMEPSDQLIPVSWSEYLVADKVIPVDWTIELFIEAYGEMPIEAVNKINMNPQKMRFEYRGNILRDNNINFEYKHIIDPSDHETPVSWQEFLSAENSVPFEYINKILTQTQKIPAEWRRTLAPFDRKINYEYKNQIDPADNQMPYHWFEYRSLNHLTPVEYLSSITKDGKIPVEHREAVLVGGNQILPIEWLHLVSQDHEMPYHWFEGVIKDAALPLQIIGTIEHDGHMPYEWLLNITTDHEMPYHWFEGREIDHQFPLAINQQLLLDRVLLIDSEGVLLPFYNTNVGKIFNLDKREFFWSMKKPSDQLWNAEKREFTWVIRRKDKYK